MDGAVHEVALGEEVAGEAFGKATADRGEVHGVAFELLEVAEVAEGGAVGAEGVRALGEAAAFNPVGKGGE